MGNNFEIGECVWTYFKESGHKSIIVSGIIVSKNPLPWDSDGYAVKPSLEADETFYRSADYLWRTRESLEYYLETVANRE